MKRIYDGALVESCLRRTRFEPELRSLREALFVAQYEKGELVVSPLQAEPLFQIVVEGSVSIYFIRDDGSAYSLASGGRDDLLGEMELFSRRRISVYAQAGERLTCLALLIEKNREAMLESCAFLRLIAKSLTRKMELLTAIDAAPASLKERVATYMRYKCPDGELKGLQQAAFHLNCSARQLQRILNEHLAEGTVVKTGKGAYRLLGGMSGQGELP